MENTNTSTNFNKLAPIVSWSAVAPSLDSTPARSPKHTVMIPVEINDKPEVAPSLDSTPVRSPKNTVMVPVKINDKPEVKFKTGSVSPRSSLSSSSASSSSSEDDDSKPNIPDGGWGWVVVFASLVLSVIADGISFSFGLLFGEFLDEFGASSSDTSWIGSLFLAVPLLTGPIMSALVDKYGCRNMTIIGGIISACGFAISSKSNSIVMMYLTFGTLAGLGLGLCYVTAVVSIAFWFDKRRTLAVGIGASGTGVGTFLFSPFTTYLIKEYQWRGATLILGGCFLHMCVCGALMVDPDWIKEQNKQNSKLSKSGKSSKTSLVSVSSANPTSIDINELKSLLKNGKDTEYLLQKLETTVQNNDDKTKLKSVFNSVLNLPTFIKEDEKLPIEVLEQLSSNKKLYNIILENYPSLLSCRSTSEKGLNSICDNQIIERMPVTFNMKLKKHPNSHPSKQHSLPEEDLAAEEPLINSNLKKSGPPSKHNASFPHLKQNLVQQHHRQHYFKNMKVHRQSLIHRNAIFNMSKYRFKASSCPNIYRVSMVTLATQEEKWYTEFVDLVKGMFDYSLFLELHFFLMSLSTIILFVWFIVPYFYLAKFMEGHNYDKSAASFTLANIGIANTIGMVSLGWAGDQPWMDMTKTYAICLVLCGISTGGFIFFIENYVMLQVSAALFGLFISSTFSFTPGILVELVPLERFTLAYGLQLLCMGIGILLGPPYAGHIFDLTKSWVQPFYQAAIWTAVSGILIAIIPYTKNRKMIGTGDVEKVIEDSKDRYIPLILCISFLVALTVLVGYFTVVTLISAQAS